MNKKTIILAGSGHAHLEVIEALSLNEILAHQFFLISPHRHTHYSGLVPRFISGDIDAHQLMIPSAEYAESKGFTFIQDSVSHVDSHHKILFLKSGKKIGFDLLSLNLGGTPPSVPTKAPDHTFNLRPLDGFIEAWQKIQFTELKSDLIQCVVVGGGAAAVEVATALKLKLNQLNNKKNEVTLVTKRSRLCPGYSKFVSADIEKKLAAIGVHFHFQEPINEIDDHFIKLKNGNRLKFHFIFIATPTTPSKIIPEPINSKLQFGPGLFSVGDGALLSRDLDYPRSGVIAVHQGRYLAQSIKKLLVDLTPACFNIPKNQLNIVITGNRSAHFIWGNLSFYGKWPYLLKKWIDRRYVNKFKINRGSIWNLFNSKM